MPERSQRDEADRRGLIGRKARDVAALAPIVGVILLATPLLSAITGGPESALPATLIYIFLVWSGLILLAYGLSRWLQSGDHGE